MTEQAAAEQAAREQAIKSLNWDDELAERAVQWRERAEMLEEEARESGDRIHVSQCRREAAVWKHCAAVLDDWVARYRGEGNYYGSE